MSDPPDSHHFGQKEEMFSCSLAPAWPLTLEVFRKPAQGGSGSSRAAGALPSQHVPGTRSRAAAAPAGVGEVLEPAKTRSCFASVLEVTRVLFLAYAEPRLMIRGIE